MIWKFKRLNRSSVLKICGSQTSKSYIIMKHHFLFHYNWLRAFTDQHDWISINVLSIVIRNVSAWRVVDLLWQIIMKRSVLLFQVSSGSHSQSLYGKQLPDKSVKPHIAHSNMDEENILWFFLIWSDGVKAKEIIVFHLYIKFKNSVDLVMFAK